MTVHRNARMNQVVVHVIHTYTHSDPTHPTIEIVPATVAVGVDSVAE